MPPPPPPPHTRPQNQAIIKSGHMGTHTPRQQPPSPTTLPSLRKRRRKSSSSSHTWPRLPLIPMRRTIMLHQYQLQPRRTCIPRNPRPTRQSGHPVANLRWATYHTQRTWSASRPRVSAGTRPCSGDGHNLLSRINTNANADTDASKPLPADPHVYHVPRD